MVAQMKVHCMPVLCIGELFFFKSKYHIIWSVRVILSYDAYRDNLGWPDNPGHHINCYLNWVIIQDMGCNVI